MSEILKRMKENADKRAERRTQLVALAAPVEWIRLKHPDVASGKVDIIFSEIGHSVHEPAIAYLDRGRIYFVTQEGDPAYDPDRGLKADLSVWSDEFLDETIKEISAFVESKRLDDRDGSLLLSALNEECLRRLM